MGSDLWMLYVLFYFHEILYDCYAILYEILYDFHESENVSVVNDVDINDLNSNYDLVN